MINDIGSKGCSGVELGQAGQHEAENDSNPPVSTNGTTDVDTNQSVKLSMAELKSLLGARSKTSGKVILSKEEGGSKQQRKVV